LSIDPIGTLYVLDRGTNEIITFKDTQAIARLGGYGWDKDGLDSPSDITTPNGLDIYVADYGNHRIVRFNRSLVPLSQIPESGAEQSLDRQIGYPRSVASSRFGKLFIVDGENNRIVKLGANNSIERTIGGIDAGKGRLMKPIKVRVSNDDRIVVQDQQHLIVYDIFGNYLWPVDNNLFQHLRSFALTDSGIIAVDSCRIYFMNYRGTAQRMIDVSAVTGRCTEIRDLFFFDKKLFLLTQHTIYRVRVVDN
jgi:hypothetical protein